MARNQAKEAWGDFVEGTFLELLNHLAIQCSLLSNLTKTFKELASICTTPLEVRSRSYISENCEI